MKENIRIRIEDYKIKLYECNNNYIINNKILEGYEDAQYIILLIIYFLDVINVK